MGEVRSVEGPGFAGEGREDVELVRFVQNVLPLQVVVAKHRPFLVVYLDESDRV